MQVNPSPDFLDAFCISVQEFDNGGRSIHVRNFGDFYQKPGDEDWHEIPDIGAFVTQNNLKRTVVAASRLTVRNVIKPRAKIVINTDRKLEIWVNVIMPTDKPIDITKIRVEAYTDKMQAFTDADAELQHGDVSTKRIVLNLAEDENGK